MKKNSIFFFGKMKLKCNGIEELKLHKLPERFSLRRNRLVFRNIITFSSRNFVMAMKIKWRVKPND